jgi:peptidoglycan hydrolase-like protein with peptidoglycan-binding domain
MRALIPLAIALCAAGAAREDTALLIANDSYAEAQDLRRAADLLRLEAPLDAAGFEVIVVENGPAEALRAAVSALVEAEETDRVLIALAGHVVRSQHGTWLLGTDADAPDLGTVGAFGVSLDVLLEIAGRAPGQAVVLLGQEARRIELGAGLSRGIAPIDAPQGVTVLVGAPEDLAGFAQGVLLRPGADLAAAVAGADELRSHGFLSSALPFLPEEANAANPEEAGGPSEEESALWAAVQELNTAGAFRAYLQQFPQGAFAEEARRRADALEAEAADPQAQAEAAEAALGLSRTQRQQIQRDLTILDYNTRGIDGIFGPGTRGAIRGWQESRGLDATGFLTGPQIAVLREAAAQRAVELEEEARIAREAEERADRAFWQATGQGRDEAALRAYLSRYPEGLFAEVARERLAEIEADRLEEAQAEERALWEEVRDLDTIDAYRRYLDAYPRGLFVAEAEARITVLQTGLTQQELAQAEAREAALNLNGQMRVLVEQRLAALGFETGRVDGTFDAQTRIAIRGYQRSRGVTATGYLDQITVVRLLADAIGGRIFE